MSFRQPPDNPELAQLWLVYKTAREREREVKHALAAAQKAVRVLRLDADPAQIAHTEDHYRAMQDVLEQAEAERRDAERHYHARHRLVMREQQRQRNRKPRGKTSGHNDSSSSVTCNETPITRL